MNQLITISKLAWGRRIRRIAGVLVILFIAMTVLLYAAQRLLVFLGAYFPYAVSIEPPVAANDATLVVYPGINHNDMPHGHGDWDDILSFLDRNDLPWQVVEE